MWYILNILTRSLIYLETRIIYLKEVIYFKEVFLSTLAHDTDKTKLLLIGTHQMLQNVPTDLDLFGHVASLKKEQQFLS